MTSKTHVAWQGVLNVNKPRGPTSRDVVNAIQRCVRPNKVGHAGTLDPLASGVLVVCLGQATRLVEYVQRMRKRYRATFRFGYRSDTDDMEGRVEQTGGDQLPPTELKTVLDNFRGEIEQVPPAYSAVKVRGKRAYHLARGQQQFELAARRVTVWNLELVDYVYPDWTVDVECSSGTYIRALGRDIAHRAGTTCVMVELTREAVGEFCLADSCYADPWEAGFLADHLLPISAAVRELPRVVVSAEQLRYLSTGRSIVLEGAFGPPDSPVPAELAAFSDEQQLVAILEPRDGLWHPNRCFI